MTAVHLVIHAGTHKTASTYLQHVLVLNQTQLAAIGIYTQPDAKMTGNHGTAWMTLLEDYRHIEAHVHEARRLGCRTVLLSSEDFETLVFDHRRARLVEEAARRAGAGSVEWTFCLRDPGEYFTSMMAQLSKLAFVDYLASLVMVLRDGRLHVIRERKRYPIYWDFCFDYAHLEPFAQGIGGSVSVHDFRDAAPFPGHGILEALGVDLSRLALPGEGSRNVRLPPVEAETNRIAQLRPILETAGFDELAIETLSARQRDTSEIEAKAKAAAHRLYAPAMEHLLMTRTPRRGERRNA